MVKSWFWGALTLGFVACAVTFPDYPGVGEKCNTTADCGEGSVCFTGYCSTSCLVDADCVAPGGHCVGTPGAQHCTTNCNLERNTECKSGDECVLVQDPATNAYYTGCVPAHTKDLNEVCLGQDCLPTLGCFPIGGTQKCAQYCYVNNATCPNCVPTATLGDVMVGYCGK